MSSLINPTVDVYLAVALTITTTWLYFLFKGPQDQEQQRKGVKTSLFLLIHTLYMLYIILVNKPTNVFDLFKLPVNTPPDTIRALLIQQSESGAVPKHLEALLTRLGSFDMRLLYVRFGHNALAKCEYCLSFEDCALFSLPQALLSYLREIAAIGFLTLGSSGRRFLRPLGVGALVIASLTEFYWIITSPLLIPNQGNDEPTYMLHDRLLNYRRLLFLILPLVIYKLPDLPVLPVPILTNLLTPDDVMSPEQRYEHHNAAIRSLEHLLPSLHLIKYTRATIMRTPELRERAAKWWDQEEKEGRWILEDENMGKTARMSGLGYAKGPSGSGEDDEPLRKQASAAVNALQAAAVPSAFWN